MRKIPILSAIALALIVTWTAAGQEVKQSYPKMAPVEQYLVDCSAAIELARTAAPDSISCEAQVLVLGRHGFETSVKGKNGFGCTVGRGWSSATDPDFWSPRVRVTVCVTAPAAHTYLLAIGKIADLALTRRNPKDFLSDLQKN